MSQSYSTKPIRYVTTSSPFSPSAGSIAYTGSSGSFDPSILSPSVNSSYLAEFVAVKAFSDKELNKLGEAVLAEMDKRKEEQREDSTYF